MLIAIKNEDLMDFFKKNYETIKSLAIIASAVFYLHHYLDFKFTAMDARFTSIETRLTKIETILIMNEMMHPSMAHRRHDTPSTPASNGEIPVLKKNAHS